MFMFMLIYYFITYITENKHPFVFFILAYLSVLFIMKPTQMRRDIYYVLCVSQCIVQIFKYCFWKKHTFIFNTFL